MGFTVFRSAQIFFGWLQFRVHAWRTYRSRSIIFQNAPIRIPLWIFKLTPFRGSIFVGYFSLVYWGNFRTATMAASVNGTPTHATLHLYTHHFVPFPSSVDSEIRFQTKLQIKCKQVRLSWGCYGLKWVELHVHFCIDLVCYCPRIGRQTADGL